MKKFSEFLDQNPELKETYVNVGFAFVDKAIGSLNLVMKHLIKVRGIDPRTQPGDTYRKVLAKVMDKVEDKEDFYDDFAVAAKGYEKVNAQLKNPLTKDEFKKFTDLSSVPDYKQVELQNKFNVQAYKVVKYPEEQLTEKEAIAEFEAMSARADEELAKEDALRAYKNSLPTRKTTSNLTPSSLKEALEVLKKYAQDFQDGQFKNPARLSNNGGLFRRVDKEED